MKTTRRGILRSALWLSAALGSDSSSAIARAAGGVTARDFKRIATEEAFSAKEVFGGFLSQYPLVRSSLFSPTDPSSPRGRGVSHDNGPSG